MKTIYKLIIATCILSFFTNCSDEPLDHQNTIEEGIPTNINLNFETKNAQSFTRATSPEKDEYKVNNLYVFIFNADGSLATRQFFDYANLDNKQEKGEKGGHPNHRKRDLGNLVRQWKNNLGNSQHQ